MSDLLLNASEIGNFRSEAQLGFNGRHSGTALLRCPLVILSALLLVCAGCANPAPPKPPSLHLPSLVTDLAAERVGNRVLLRWTTPARTTDGFAVKGAMQAQICREVGARPGSSAPRPAACSPILRLAVSPGPSEVADVLPAPLCSGPAVLLSYRIQLLNSAERSAGDSSIAAFAATGAAPTPVDSLTGTASEQGAVLEWPAEAKAGDQVELTRRDLSPVEAAAKPAKSDRRDSKSHNSLGHDSKGQGLTAARKPSSQPAGEVRLMGPEVLHQTQGGMLDATAKFGATYSYTVARLRPVRIGAHLLEIRSDPSPPVTIAMQDKFPPREPAGLATVPGRGDAGPYIDLSWEPNVEPDLAGYLVHRQLARPGGGTQGPQARLTPSPITVPAFRDVAVSPGPGYIYWVTAVDAFGNESAPSAKAQEVVTPNRSEQPGRP